MTLEFVEALRRRQASTSVGPSAARGMGPAGTIQAARDFLASIDLNQFCVNTEKEFIANLNKTTRSLSKKLPSKAQRWGSARKFINIFLRSVAYNKYLCKHYKLSQIEPWLEIPLDSHVYKGLKKDGREYVDTFPRWVGVIHLTPKLSKKYQCIAAKIAEQMKVYRVHLDLIYWRADFTTKSTKAKSKK